MMDYHATYNKECDLCGKFRISWYQPGLRKYWCAQCLEEWLSVRENAALDRLSEQKSASKPADKAGA